MTAALDYATAWVPTMLPGALICGLLPLAYIGNMRGWAAVPSSNVLLLVAAVPAAFGAAMWWYWLVRLGSTAPPKNRGRVSAFLGVGVPLIVAALVAGWYFGLMYALSFVSELLRFRF